MGRSRNPKTLLIQLLLSAAALAALTFAIVYVLARQKVAAEHLNAAINRDRVSYRLAEQLHQSSDDLTRMVRSYAVTGDSSFEEYFYTVLRIRNGEAPRPKDYDRFFWAFRVVGETPADAEEGERIPLQTLMSEAGFTTEEFDLLGEAQRRSDDLVRMEETAMKAMGGRFRDESGAFTIVKEPDRELALQILFGDEYHRAKSRIMRPIREFLVATQDRTSKAIADAQKESRAISLVLATLFGGILVVLPFFVVACYRYHRASTGELRERETSLQALLNAPLETIAMVGRDGTLLNINENGAQRLGGAPEDLIGRSVYEILPEDVGRRRKPYFEQVFSTGQPVRFEDERRGVHFANSMFPVHGSDGAAVTAVAVFAEDVTRRRKAEEDLRAYQDRLRALAGELTLSEERERSRIAAELHDGAAQMLALARMKLEEFGEAVAGSAAAAKLDDASQTVRESIEHIRSIILDLSSQSLGGIGLGSAVSEWLEDVVGRRHKLKTEFHDACGNVALTNEARTMLFRNTRELLTNVVKHAAARKVSVRIERSGQTLRLSVQDDGIGLDLESAARRPSAESGFGLFSIRERMADLGGSLDIVSATGEGCTATLIAPLAGGEL